MKVSNPVAQRWGFSSVFTATCTIAWAISAMLPGHSVWAEPPAPAPSSAPQATAVAQIDYDHNEDTTLYFKGSNGPKSPKPVKTDLHDLKYLGALRPVSPTEEESASAAYFLFSGRPCKDCLQDIGIYAIRPLGGRQASYVYPGKIFEHKSRALVLESRSFFGRCLARQLNPVYLVFQKERIDRKSGMQSSVLIAEPGSDHMDERLIERHLPRLQDTLKLVKSKVCHEIDGRNRIMLSRPLDVKARHSTEAESDDDDDTKENQTDDDLEPAT